jgi:Phosphotransferase enzyme family
MISSSRLPIRAAMETALAHGITPDRCDILQDSSTLVLRLTETLVARVVQDTSGPRQGTEWFQRENAIALHLTEQGAPVIPLHPDLPPGPHQHLGFPMNFWQFVTQIDSDPEPREIGLTLLRCHEIMRSFPEALPKLAILTESLSILEERALFPQATQEMLQQHLRDSIAVLSEYPHQPLHGDAHLGNFMNTTSGLLLTDWEDTFSGPIEWDLASVIWNAQLLENDVSTVQAIRDAYGPVDERALHQSLIGRAAVMTAWYPILYPNPSPERQSRLSRRIEWLEKMPTQSA